MGIGEVEGSPAYSFENAGIIAGGNFDTFDFETQANRIAKWLPFDAIEVNNASTVNIDVYVNGSPNRRFFVAGGASKVYKDAKIYIVKVRNRSAATDIAAGDLIVTAMKERMSADKGVYKLVGTFFSDKRGLR